MSCLPRGSLRPSERPLGVMDCGMLSTDRVLRSIGHPDFETQTLVWLEGRLDRERLERGLGRLARRHPILSARLDDRLAARPVWRIPSEPAATLHEVPLDESSESAVHACAARLLATPHDPATADPMRFHLLRLPDGRDVFLVQYTHVLTDINAALPVLREIDRLAAGSAGGDDSTSPDETDAVSNYLQRHSLRQRLTAALRVLDLRFRSFRGGAVTLGGSEARETSRAPAPPVRFEMAARSLSVDESQRVSARSAQICGVPSVSMALLAAAFRALGRHTSERPLRRRSFLAGIGVDLGNRGRQSLAFQNLMSIVPLRAGWRDLDDYERLVRLLHEQFRSRLRNAADLGLLELARFVSVRPRLADRTVRRVMLGGYSLWYAYFGSLDALGTEFCGTRVGNVYFTAPTWPPMGLTLLATQFRGRMHFATTSMPDLVPPATVDAFVETMLADVRS
ncbi:MAG TPA: condensation domain-containing protein [Planctomycetaceae bacterium]|nr:condensation domain-containing protein [Planctomycetaceae bacterium]